MKSAHQNPEHFRLKSKRSARSGFRQCHGDLLRHLQQPTSCVARSLASERSVTSAGVTAQTLTAWVLGQLQTCIDLANVDMAALYWNRAAKDWPSFGQEQS